MHHRCAAGIGVIGLRRELSDAGLERNEQRASLSGPSEPTGRRRVEVSRRRSKQDGVVPARGKEFAGEVCCLPPPACELEQSLLLRIASGLRCSHWMRTQLSDGSSDALGRQLILRGRNSATVWTNRTPPPRVPLRSVPQ